MMRDDIAAVETAKELGFKVVRTSNRSRIERSEYHIGDPIPHNPLSFEIGRIVVWQVRGGWHFAELIDGHYTNHSQVMNLSSCLVLASRVHQITLKEVNV
ncbi:hypothetical protein J4N45_10505 [Vibrio sp. SCSIO 43140]|uniref:hypothetical protein n=1 Tax=Vibrio sp. SCSIO 43140 TaxID=2819100 RepID=UPI0020754652|nr:hypothetical protein [Vibrio sp. SCSIO 43140]USD58961.1 hypothetical protein J4N45_10505 [Vibrio sp. SCSIO 43140]